MASKKYKVSESLVDLVNGLYDLNKAMPEINRRMVQMIASEALDIARAKLEAGDFTGHGEFTEELTHKLSKGARSTAWLMDETGALKKSLRTTVSTVSMGNIHVEIGSDLVYAAILEYGGDVGGAVPGAIIPPRPYLKPAIEEAMYNAISWAPEYLTNEYEAALTAGNKSSSSSKPTRKKDRAFGRKNKK